VAAGALAGPAYAARRSPAAPADAIRSGVQTSGDSQFQQTSYAVDDDGCRYVLPSVFNRDVDSDLLPL
jgi:hypothetical protein